MTQQSKPSIGQQAQMMTSIGKQMAASYVGYTIVICLVIGLAVGWFIFGWLIAPVQWYDAKPSSLSTQYQQRYLSYSADSLAMGTPIDQVATNLGEGWKGTDVVAMLNEMVQQGWPNSDRLTRLSTELTARQGQIGPQNAVKPAGIPADWVPWLVGLLFLGVVVLGLFIIRRLRAEQDKASAEQAKRVAPLTHTPTATGEVETEVAEVPEFSHASGGARKVEKTQWAGETQPPLAQYVTTYNLGDDRYDMSFSIETVSGDFLGECGVGISETIGTGSPDKVTALEVWLFDKNDIRTVTKVLMSEHAFNDQAIRAKLAPKGDAYLARKGEVVTLLTQTLKVSARIDDLLYGSGSLPPSSFFQKVDIELGAWSIV